MRSLEAKIVVLGSQGVGKTSLVLRYVGKLFPHTVSPTIGASFFTFKMTVENYRVKLQLWDTAGQERFRSMAPMYYRKANAAMLVYDITSLSSFESIQGWVTELKRNVEGGLVLCLVGNKTDLGSQRAVSREQAQEYAESIDACFFETSALTNSGVQEAFLRVSLGLIKMNKEILSDMSDEISLRPSIGTERMDAGIDGQIRMDKSKQADKAVSGPGGRCCRLL
jgi:Ras-related protein Rab-21